MKITQNDINRFYSHIITDWKNNPNECWEMDTFHDKDGYPKFSIKSNSKQACRISYIMHNGEIPIGMQIRHTCHNTNCVNPKHLLYGTAKQNSNDTILADRQAKGSNNGNSILTEENVIEMLIKINNNEFQNIEHVAKYYKIDRHTINNIFFRITWKHITDKLQIPLEEIKKKIIPERYKKGSKHYKSILTEEKVKQILIDIDNYKYKNVRQISIKYNVSIGTITDILNGKNWKDITNQLQVPLIEVKKKVMKVRK